MSVANKLRRSNIDPEPTDPAPHPELAAAASQNIDQTSADSSEARLRRSWQSRTAALIFGGLLVLALFLPFIATRERKSVDQLVADGRLALSEREHDVASRYADQAIQLNHNSEAAWELSSESKAQSGELDQSLFALETLAKLDRARGAKLGLQLGRRWMMENRVRHAMPALRLAEAGNPAWTEPFRWQAQMAGALGRPREVVRCVIELIKRNAFTRNDLIVVTSANPITADGQRLAQIIELDPESRFNILAYVMHDLTLNRIDEAKRRLIEITEARPGDSESQGFLGEIYADGAPREFLEWNSRLTPDADADSRVWVARGKWLRHQGALSSAIRCLHEAFLREPELQSANFLLGQLLTQVGETKLGEEFTERGKRLQRIISLSARMNDQRANDWILPIITDLQETGRIWEAWGWFRILEQSALADAKTKTLSQLKILKENLSRQLTAELPRTHPDFLPGKDFDWNHFPLPNWSDYKSFLAPASEKNGRTEVVEQQAQIEFVDQTAQSGLDFHFVTAGSPKQGRKIFETMGAGVGVLDYDLDEWPDLYFPQGSTSATDASVGPSDVLYRNQAGKQYINVTQPSGIHETTFSQGVGVGDFDCDGFPDIYVANLGKNCLLQNNGDGTFTDVTAEAGLSQSAWTVSCAIADLNGDGFPELFDVNYVQGPKLFTGMCYDQHGRAGICRPVVYDPATDTVALNQGNGRFLEQQSECGLDLPQGMGLGLVIADFNDDGRVDLFVANDMTPNYLLINEQDTPEQPLHFRDEAFLRGVALDQNGFSQACMGIACADINRDGVPDLLITNFAREYNAFYLSQPGGFYQDQIRAAGLSEASFDPLGFGTQFVDADHDGWYDLALVNGQIDEIPNEPYRMKAQFFRGSATGQFTELFATDTEGVFGKQRLGRGLASLDWNRDGKVDLVATDFEENVLLAENQTRGTGNQFRLRLVGTNSSRDAIGARLRIRLSSTDQRVVQLTAGDGYESSNQRMIDVGIGPVDQIEEIEIRWPSGHVETKTGIDVKTTWLAIEGSQSWLPVIAPE